MTRSPPPFVWRGRLRFWDERRKRPQRVVLEAPDRPCLNVPVDQYAQLVILAERLGVTIKSIAEQIFAHVPEVAARG